MRRSNSGAAVTAICAFGFMLGAFAGRTAAADEIDALVCTVDGDPAQLATGRIDSVTGLLDAPVRIYSASADVVAGVDAYLGDEGFFAVSDTAELPDGYALLAASVDLRFDLKTFALGAASSNLWRWDPAANPAVEFVPVSGGVTVAIQKSPTTFFTATVTGADADVAGFTIDRTSSAGALHKHLTLRVDDADPDLGTIVPTGIYVISYVLSYPGATAEPSYLVINGGLGAAGAEDVDAALAWLESELFGTPECPGDVNGDAVVDLSDLGIVLANWARSDATREDGDLDGDMDVDLSDLGVVLSEFLSPC